MSSWRTHGTAPWTGRGGLKARSPFLQSKGQRLQSLPVALCLSPWSLDRATRAEVRPKFLQPLLQIDPKHDSHRKRAQVSSTEGKLCFKSSSVGLFFLYLEKKKAHTIQQHTLHYRIHGRRKTSAPACGIPDPAQGTRSRRQAAGPVLGPTVTCERAAGALSVPPRQKRPTAISIKSRGAKFLPEGAKKVTNWMNETGLRALGAGLSLESEKEKSKVF